MTSVDDTRKNSIPRESGKRLYVSPKDYSTHMRNPTIKGMDTGKEPWSEFEKPYWEDSYEEMEYFMWNYPGFPNHDFEMSWDNPSFPTTEGASLGGGGFIVFTCNVYGGFCPGDTRNIGLSCSHPVTDVALTWPTLAGAEFTVELVSPTSVAITAAEDAGGGVEIDIFMQTAAGITGSHENILIGSASDCEDCETADLMEADPNNATVVADSTNYSISVLYGVGPYAWSVSAPQSPDVALQNAVTTGRSNTLQVTDGCGTIVVNVIDSCGTDIDMIFRGDGAWTYCISSGAGGNPGCICPGATYTSPADFGGGGNPYNFASGGREWRFYDTVLSECFGVSPIQTCCDPEPCGATFNCWGYFNTPTVCTDPTVTPPCLNPCTGGCGCWPRDLQVSRIDYWECT